MKDNEWAGVGNHYSAEYWEYDPRTARRYNTDPIRKPWISPYSTFDNSPIALSDVNGDDPSPTDGDGGGDGDKDGKGGNTVNSGESGKPNNSGGYTLHEATVTAKKPVPQSKPNEAPSGTANSSPSAFERGLAYMIYTFGKSMMPSNTPTDSKTAGMHAMRDAAMQMAMLVTPGFNSEPEASESSNVATTAEEEAAELDGSFSISNWEGYPEGTPKPTGPFRLLEGEEYEAARNLANQTNAKIHLVNRSIDGLQIHEIHPIKFGGNPTNFRTPCLSQFKVR
jgi:hypothetical protein